MILFAAAVRAHRDGNDSAALRLFDRFIRSYPDAGLFESAVVQRMRVLAVSEPRAAAAAATRYLQRFPDGFARGRGAGIAARCREAVTSIRGRLALACEPAGRAGARGRVRLRWALGLPRQGRPRRCRWGRHRRGRWLCERRRVSPVVIALRTCVADLRCLRGRPTLRDERVPALRYGPSPLRRLSRGDRLPGWPDLSRRSLRDHLRRRYDADDLSSRNGLQLRDLLRLRRRRRALRGIRDAVLPLAPRDLRCMPHRRRLHRADPALRSRALRLRRDASPSPIARPRCRSAILTPVAASRADVDDRSISGRFARGRRKGPLARDPPRCACAAAAGRGRGGSARPPRSPP